jgi:hypothetical protein
MPNAKARVPRIVAISILSSSLAGCFSLGMMIGDTLYTDQLQGKFENSEETISVEISGRGTNDFQTGSVVMRSNRYGECKGDYRRTKQSSVPFSTRSTYAGPIKCPDRQSGEFEFVASIGLGKGTTMGGNISGNRFRAQ